MFDEKLRTFKKMRGIELTYNQQGLIYFTCINVKMQPQEVQDKILNLCVEVAKEEHQALYTMLTRQDLNVVGVSLKYEVSEKTLYKWRKEFYEKWYKKSLEDI